MMKPTSQTPLSEGFRIKFAKALGDPQVRFGPNGWVVDGIPEEPELFMFLDELEGGVPSKVTVGFNHVLFRDFSLVSCQINRDYFSENFGTVRLTYGVRP